MCLKLPGSKIGCYERRLCVLLFLASITGPFSSFQALIIQYTPPHRCNVFEEINVSQFNSQNETLHAKENVWKEHILNLTIPWEKDSLGIQRRSSCKQYNTSTFFFQENTTGFNHTPSTILCNSIYYYSNASSATTEFGMVCEKAWEKPLFTSIFIGGNGIGGIVGGFLSDRFGRKRNYLFFTFLQFITFFATSFTKDTVLFGVLMFVSGMGDVIRYVTASLIASELVPTELRTFSYFTLAAGFGAGYVALAPFMYFFEDWRWFLRVSSLLSLIYIPYFWLLDETPFWLMATGKMTEANKILRKVANINKQPPKCAKEQLELLKSKTELNQGSWRTFRDVFCNGILFLRLSIVSASWGIVSLTYYAIALNTNSLSGSRILNLFFAGLVEIMAAVLYFMFARSYGRRNSYMACMAVCSLSVAITPFIVLWNGGVAVASTMLSKLTVSIAFNVIYVYTGELFPTKARQSSLGTSSAAARLGSISAPFIIYAGKENETLAPSLGMAAFMFLSVFSYMFLPETRKQRLPQSVKEAVELNGGVKLKCPRKRKYKQENQVEHEESNGLTSV